MQNVTGTIRGNSWNFPWISTESGVQAAQVRGEAVGAAGWQHTAPRRSGTATWPGPIMLWHDYARFDSPFSLGYSRYAQSFVWGA